MIFGTATPQHVHWPTAFNPGQDTPCQDPGAFHRFDAGAGPKAKQARLECLTCPVRDACLDAALWEESVAVGSRRYGVRGAMLPGEREREHDRRGLVYLCTDCWEAPRQPRSAYCVECVARHEAERKDRWEARVRIDCPQCGGPMARGSQSCQHCMMRLRYSA